MACFQAFRDGANRTAFKPLVDAPTSARDRSSLDPYGAHKNAVRPRSAYYVATDRSSQRVPQPQRLDQLVDLAGRDRAPQT